MEELLKRAAEALGMPPALAERSAQARAAKEGISVEDVLREWAGEDAPASEDESADEPAPGDDASTQGSDSTPAASGPPDPPPSDSTETGPSEISTDYLVQLAAEAKRMPPKLVRSSAQARADNSNKSLDEVLATWAGHDLADLHEKAAAGNAPAVAAAESSPSEPPSADPAPPPTPTADEPASAPEPATPSAPAAAGVALSMDELLEKVAEAKGMPAALAKRSAEARAKKTGEPVEAVLAEWAGVDPSQVATADAAPATAATAPSEPAAPTETTDEPAAKEAAADDVEVIRAVDADTSDADDDDFDDVEPFRSRGYPAWLAAAFVLIPILAVTYILISPNGPDCGTAGQLRIDEATGLAVNCDGSEYGSNQVDFFAQGAAIFAQCTACHGADGGGGSGPAFAGGAVLATFPTGMCNDHIEWVSVGTAGWPEPTYGATDKPVGGVGLMPAFSPGLSEEQIASVALYERVQFGGEDLDVALEDCGLVVPEDGEMSEDATVEANG